MSTELSAGPLSSTAQSRPGRLAGVPNVPVASRGDLTALGWSAARIRAAVETGSLHRIRAGRFVDGLVHAGLDNVQRHALLTMDLARSLRPGAVISHTSAAAVRGVRLPPELILDRVHLTWPNTNGRNTSAHIQPHRARIEPADTWSIDGIVVTTPARTVYDLARSLDQMLAVSVADGALRDGLCTREDFDLVLERASGLRDWATASQVMRFADGRAVGDGQSQTRVLFARLGLPTAELAVPDQYGEVADFLFRSFGVIARFAERPGREARMTATAPTTAWILRDDLQQPSVVLHKVRTAFAAAGHSPLRRHFPILDGPPRSLWEYPSTWT